MSLVNGNLKVKKKMHHTMMRKLKMMRMRSNPKKVMINTSFLGKCLVLLLLRRRMDSGTIFSILEA